jgi:hypothetical protein
VHGIAGHGHSRSKCDVLDAHKTSTGSAQKKSRQPHASLFDPHIKKEDVALLYADSSLALAGVRAAVARLRLTLLL